MPRAQSASHPGLGLESPLQIVLSLGPWAFDDCSTDQPSWQGRRTSRAHWWGWSCLVPFPEEGCSGQYMGHLGLHPAQPLSTAHDAGDGPWKALGMGLRAPGGVHPGLPRERGTKGSPGGWHICSGLAVARAGGQGSELGPGVALQQLTHVQERLLQVVRHAGSVGLSTAVVG